MHHKFTYESCEYKIRLCLWQVVSGLLLLLLSVMMPWLWHSHHLPPLTPSLMSNELQSCAVTCSRLLCCWPMILWRLLWRCLPHWGGAADPQNRSRPLLDGDMDGSDGSMAPPPQHRDAGLRNVPLPYLAAQAGVAEEAREACATGMASQPEVDQDGAGGGGRVQACGAGLINASQRMAQHGPKESGTLGWVGSCLGSNLPSNNCATAQDAGTQDGLASTAIGSRSSSPVPAASEPVPAACEASSRSLSVSACGIGRAVREASTCSNHEVL